MDFRTIGMTRGVGGGLLVKEGVQNRFCGGYLKLRYVYKAYSLVKLDRRFNSPFTRPPRAALVVAIQLGF